MASYISIPRDLTRVKTKVLFNLTKRQLICFGLGAIAGLPVFFALRYVQTDIGNAVLGMMAVMMPFFLLAMYEKNGRPLEEVLGQIIRCKFIRPKVRPYRTKNYYSLLEKQAQLEEEVRKIVERSNGFVSKEKEGGV